MKTIKYVIGWVSIFGLIGFSSIVLVLQVLQPDYDPIHQLISELALGPYGFSMFFAFLFLAVAVIGIQFGLGIYGVSLVCRVLLVMAAIGLIGAGIFRLDNAMELHIGFVAVAFILLGLAMYLLPRKAGMLNSRSLTILSWSLGVSTALSVFLGNVIIPIGLAQRFAVMCVLIWLSWLGWKITHFDSN